MSTTPEVEPTPVPGAPVALDLRHRRRLLAVVVGLTVAVLAVDQLTKIAALRSLDEQTRVPVVGDLLGLRLVFNPGAALSIGTGMTWVLTVVAVVVVVVVARASRRIGSRGWAVALGLLLGGALGNLVDRLVREPGVGRGEVVDFIAYGDLFVGNVADIAIVAAAGLIMLLAVRGISLDGTREHPADRRAANEHATDGRAVSEPEADLDAPVHADDSGQGRDRADG